MADLFDEPLDNDALNQAVGIISKAVQYTDSKGKKFTQEQLDFLRVWSQELYELGYKAANK